MTDINIKKYNLKRKVPGYWNEETTIIELDSIIEELNHFPTQIELNKMNRNDLLGSITRNGGINHFREKMGYELIRKPKDFWTEENIVIELDSIIEEINHFPTHAELNKIKKSALSNALRQNGGINKFKELLGYKITRKSVGYWEEKIIISELKIIIEKLGHFPIYPDLLKINRNDLIGAITQHGGINHFRRLLEYEPLQERAGYWTEEIIISELEPIIEKLGHFPTYSELTKMNKSRLSNIIPLHNNINYFREKMGYSSSLYETYISELLSYIGKRGKSSEKLVKEIIIEWCEIHNLSQPDFNVKLAKGNIIEFVCDLDKRIGIDVTNTKASKSSAYTTIQNKWKHKDYRLYLDELWIVVFTDILSSEDYSDLNIKSPENVKVFSINGFLEELDYSTNHCETDKIDKLKNCSFHNKKEIISINI